MAGTATRFGVPRVRAQGVANPVQIIAPSEIPTVNYSTGAADALRRFSQNMFSLAADFDKRLDLAAEEQGAREGALDALGGNYVEKDFTTIRGRAYNRAGLETFIATMETNSILKIDELRRTYANDPIKLQEELSSYRSGVVEELKGVDPRLAAGFEQRFTVRALPTVEGARDNRFRMNRDAADAAIVRSESALNAELRTVAGDIFSENPERSAAAANAVGMLQADMFQIYNAVDATTGKPLYTEEEKAKAQQGFYDTVMESAAVSWFDAQDNKADAYLKFTEEDFAINLQTPGQLSGNAGSAASVLAGKGWAPIAVAAIIGHGQQESGKELNTGAVGDGGTAGGGWQWRGERLRGLRQFAAQTGGDPSSIETQAAYVDWELRNGDEGAKRAGELLKNARTLDQAVDAFMYFERPAGFTSDNPRGGHGWDNRYKNAAAAFNTLSTPEVTPINVRTAISAESLSRIETNMRQRISFSNSLADRDAAIEAAEVDARQERADYEATVAILSPSGAVDPATNQPYPKLGLGDVTRMMRDGAISPTAGKALVKILTTEAPDVSDRVLHDDIVRRVYQGEDMREFIYANIERLSRSDSLTLLQRNDSLNVAGAGSLSNEQQFYETRLRDLMEPDGLMAELDEGSEQRKFLALDEYRRRVLDGEPAREVARDLAERSAVDVNEVFKTGLEKLIKPRFYAPGTTPGRVDIPGTANNINKALRENRLTETEYFNQVELLQRWQQLQARVDGGN
jgi:Phage tail lysozyme